MSANETVRTIFRATLGDDRECEYITADFFASPLWERYQGDVDAFSTVVLWEDVVLDVLAICRHKLEFRVAHPAVFHGDE